MANYNDWVANGGSKLDWAMPFQRTGAFPLDRTDLFSSLDDAEKYAAGGADSRGLSGSSYVGQIITVWENGVVKAYQIQEDRSLSELGSGGGQTIDLSSYPFYRMMADDGKPAVMINRSDGVSLVEYMRTVEKPGLYLCYVQSGTKNNPPKAETKGSSLRGMFYVHLTHAENGGYMYAWIILFDQDGEMYTQYIRGDSAEDNDRIWANVGIPDKTLSLSGTAADAKSVKDYVDSVISNLGPSEPEELILGHALYYNEENKLSVKMASETEADKTLPISAADVETTVGNIETLLSTI